MKIVRLDKTDINYLVRLILEQDKNKGTPSNELSDTKVELIKQAKQNIANLVNDEKVGTIVALFLFVLTDEESVMMIRQIANRFDNYLDGGGKETDFTLAVTRALKPLTTQFIKSIVGALKKRAAKRNADDVFGQQSIEINQSEDSSQGYNVLKSSSTKTKLRQIALHSINQLINNPDIIQVISMFLLYLTDKQTVADLKALGATYGKQLDELIDKNGPSWAKGLIKEVRNKFTPLVEKMAEAVDEQLKGIQTKDNIKDSKEIEQQFQKDKMVIQNLIQKYNIR